MQSGVVCRVEGQSPLLCRRAASFVVQKGRAKRQSCLSCRRAALFVVQKGRTERQSCLSCRRAEMFVAQTRRAEGQSFSSAEGQNRRAESFVVQKGSCLSCRRAVVCHADAQLVLSYKRPLLFRAPVPFLHKW